MGFRGAQSGARLRWWVAHLLLSVFVLRALIPVGYMPDFSAVAQGVFKVVICSASGAKTLTVDSKGHHVPDKSSPSHDQPCAFAGIAKFATPVLDVIPVASPEVADQPVAFGDFKLRPPVRAGPALGSRGPPLFS